MRILLGLLAILLLPAESLGQSPRGDATVAGQPMRVVRVIVALCDNEAQGIAPVPAKIGKGDDPEHNLYWGCDEALPAVFGQAAHWRPTRHEAPESSAVLRRIELVNSAAHIQLIAEAYRGAEIRACLQDFERCLARGDVECVVYLGHNGLMDFELPEIEPPPAPTTRPPAAIVLCCKSQAYFEGRIRRLGARPLLLTTQFMYPAACILREVLEVWPASGDPAALRRAAGAAYARNQGISLQAATGVFAKLPAE